MTTSPAPISPTRPAFRRRGPASARPPLRLRLAAFIGALALAVGMPLLTALLVPAGATATAATPVSAQSAAVMVSAQGAGVVAQTVDQNRLVNDVTGSLTPPQVNELDSRARDIEARYGMAPIIIFYDRLDDGVDGHVWAIEYLEATGHGVQTGQGAIALTIAVQTRDITVISVGPGEEVADIHGTDDIRDTLLDPLGDDEWYPASSLFLDETEAYLQAWQAGTPYSEDNPRHPETAGEKAVKWGGTGAGALAGGGAAGGGVMWWLLRKNRTARRKADADDYLAGRPHMTRINDLYLYSTTSTRTIEAPSSGGTSRSGGGYTSSSSKF
ncbi:MAG TPA: TPM domain-containing protein [Actinomycetales bacterium]|nr:TPM domain-containing protein [Actinomycetales bacterium]